MRSMENYSLWSKSICLLSSLLALELEANVIIYSSCISACEKSLQWLKALELLEDLVGRSIQVDTVLYSTVISAQAQAGRGFRDRHKGHFFFGAACEATSREGEVRTLAIGTVEHCVEMMYNIHIYI